LENIFVPKISVFVPCLIDQVYPEMGLSMVRIFRHLGYEVHYDSRATCCGQPAFNAGHWDKARDVAKTFLDVFEESRNEIVCPSGSCTAMVRNYYPELFEKNIQINSAKEVSQRIFEFCEFLSRPDIKNKIIGNFPARVGFHTSCHSVRELRIGDKGIQLAQQIAGVEIFGMDREPVCCGFGGLFSIKFPNISSSMGRNVLDKFVDDKVTTIVSNDPGCIMHMRQTLEERNISIKVFHIAEFLSKAMNLE